MFTPIFRSAPESSESNRLDTGLRRHDEVNRSCLNTIHATRYFLIIF